MAHHDVTVRGMALEDFGFTANNTIDGYGLLTDGFLWGCASIWGPYRDAVTTTWTSCSASSSNVETCVE